MTKARDLANLIAAGNPLADGAISVAEISDLTASAADLNKLDGVTASTTEINKLDGLTSSTADLNNVAGINSSVQTQLNAKAPLASPTLTGTVTMGGTTYPNSDGTEGQVLTTNGSGAVSFADPAGGGSADFVASGAIANGDVVVLNSNGTVSVAGFADPSVGSPTTFTNGNPPEKDVVFDSLNNKVVVVYRDMGNSSSGTAIVGTVNGSSISFGTPVVFKAGLIESISATFDTNNNKVVVVYGDNTNSSYGTAIVGTVNGTSISFGSPTVFNSIGTSDTSCTFDTNNNKVVVAYRSYQTYPYDGTAIVGTVSGTSISFGTATVYESARTSYNSAVFDSSNNKIVIAYVSSSSTERAVVGTVNGTSISFGTPVTFSSEGAAYLSAAFDSINNKIAIAYYGSAGAGKALVGTVSGNSISFGTTVTFNVRAAYITTTFDVGTGKVVVAYRDFSTGKPFIIVGTISGTSISFGTALQYSTNNSSWLASAYDSNSNKVIIADQNNNGSTLDGKVVVFDSGSTNASSYIGVADGAISNSATGKITINGGVNEGQSSLAVGTTYYVADNGDLQTTNNGRKIGKAISATKLLVNSNMSGDEMNAYLGGLV